MTIIFYLLLFNDSFTLPALGPPYQLFPTVDVTIKTNDVPKKVKWKRKN